MIDDTARRQFQAVVWKYYRAYGRRDLPWRVAEPDGSFDPYKIMVSEVMLQQTQVRRVIPKYHEFLKQFPVTRALAEAPLSAVLQTWSGLGYNRRAKFLHQAAQQVVQDYDGAFPQSVVTLQALPGIGHNTAAAIVTYAFNQPTVFVETNIRTVFLYHFFHDQTAVNDKAILEIVEQTLPASEKSREWYWALMDYGSHLKQTVGNPNDRSLHYTKQSKFEGSKRQIRGQVIRLLGQGMHTRSELRAIIQDARLETVLTELLAENLILKKGRYFQL